ncbi:MAG: hypothetical protein NUV91_06880 [Candidatus Omnitrophica bacterium]|nr:hypothetical protein [Candidatus Omnitrophota bacterium]
MVKTECQDLIFKHLIEMPASNCIFCSTKERTTGRSRLFLFFQDRDRIYRRNGLKGTWEELSDQEGSRSLQRKVENILLKRNIPCYTSLTAVV